MTLERIGWDTKFNLKDKREVLTKQMITLYRHNTNECIGQHNTNECIVQHKTISGCLPLLVLLSLLYTIALLQETQSDSK